MDRSNPKTAALLAALLALPGLTSAQEPSPTPTPPPADGQTEIKKTKRVAARVTRTSGKAKVQRPGEEEWKPLELDSLLESGDRVHAKGDAVEIVVPEDKKDLENTAANGGNRVVLAPGAKATVDPLNTPADMRLDEGDCFAQANRALKVLAGKSLLTVNKGDAEIKLKRKGSVEVTVHSGSVDLESPEGKKQIGARRLVLIDATGKPVRDKPARPTPPKYTQPTPKKLIWAWVPREWPPGTDYYLGTLVPREKYVRAALQISPDTSDGSEDPNNWGHWGWEVRFEQETSGQGYFLWEEGAHIRLRVWLSKPSQCGLQFKPRDLKVDANDPEYEDKQPPNIWTDLREVRGQVWTDLDFDPAAFQSSNPDRTNELKAGHEVHLMVLFGGGLTDDLKPEDPNFEMRVSRVLVYLPKGAKKKRPR